MRNIVLIILSWLWGAIPILADGYDPTNPQDPYMQYKVTASVTPTAAGTASTSGKYRVGTVITMNTSASSTDYTFKHWTKNGEVYSSARRFSYTVTNEAVDFVAVYEYTPQEEGGGGTVVYNPANPADPYLNLKEHEVIEDKYYTLSFASNLAGACSFNITSGISVKENTVVMLECYPNQNFVFKGWYNGAYLVSSSQSFEYTVRGNSILTARFEKYSPYNPDDPDQSDVKRYNLKYVVDGEEYKTFLIASGSTITPLEVPVRNGYKFSGWSKIPATMPAEDVTIVGNFTRYLIKGDVNGDLTVTRKDAEMIVDFYLGKDVADFIVEVADVNGDGKVTMQDANEVMNIYLGK